MLTEIPEITLSSDPDRILIFVDKLSPAKARAAANEACNMARKRMPKMSGASARHIQPLYGKGFFGIYFPDRYTWFQEQGIRPFTMNNLQGKTIPMWVKDSDGKLRAKNPKIKTKTTEDGRTLVLIFRKAAIKGSRKVVYRRDPVTGIRTVVSDKPQSYPGAPGRIGTRVGKNDTGQNAGQIARTNVGVRWRHPGLAPKLFLNNSMALAAQRYGILPVRVYIADRNWRGELGH
jgi:hypothetical protein